MQTVIYCGDLEKQRQDLQISFTDACEMVFGVRRANRLTVGETIDFRRRLADGEVFNTRTKWQIWMEEN